MLHIYEEIAGPAVILKINTPCPRQRDYRDLSGRIVKQGMSYLLVLVAAYGCFRFSQRYILQTVQVDGQSMAPTLRDAKCYLLNQLVYCFREPRPMDIVALRDPEDNGLAVKRIVAQPGDSVYLNGGRLFVNGKPLVETYLEPATKTYASSHYRAQMWICGLHQYFVLGDNRNNSADSRLYGAVPRQNIIGMVMCRDFAGWF